MNTITINPREHDLRVNELRQKATRRSREGCLSDQEKLERLADVLELNHQAKELDEQWNRQWKRFYFLKHLHNSRTCGSFRWNSRWAWLPELSGMSDEEAVAEYGSDLCTKCVKSAPVA
jgi:hypothetical protein